MCTGNRCSCVSAAPNLVRKAGAAAVRGHTGEGVLALMWPANACRWWRPAAALACMRRACALIVHPCPCASLCALQRDHPNYSVAKQRLEVLQVCGTWEPFRF